MWSEKLSESRRLELIAGLRRALPVPGPSAISRVAVFERSASPEPVATALQNQPGFLWLDRPDSPHRIFTRPLVTISASSGAGLVEGPGGRFEFQARGLDIVEAALEAWKDLPNAFLAGYFGYELGAELEDLATSPRDVSDPPDLWLGFYDSMLQHDGHGWELHFNDAWRPVEIPQLSSEAAQVAEGPLSRGPVTSSPAPEAFQQAVARTVQRIYDGEVFQVNLCRSLEAPLHSSMIWPAYVRLRSISPASQGAFLRLDAATALLSISPELFLRVENGRVTSHPIKGTRPRGSTPQEDRNLASELAASEKDRAELAMIVDVVRNDLGRVCAPGSIAVTRHAELITLPTIHHTFSEVTGRLREKAGIADLLRASFPPASISGAPKIRAIEIVALEENQRRGPCMGAIGWISLDGRMELSVAIRTAVASHGRVRYLAGCGITSDSDPAEELAESEAKAAAFLQALGLC